MGDQAPGKSDIAVIFKRLRSLTANKACFDCNAKNPTWASVTYGVFICIDCSAIHRSLGVHVSFVRSIQLDTNWTWLQLRAMQVGGNANAKTFFAEHNCSSIDAQQKYSSRAAQLYREKLHNLSVNAMRTHGEKLHIDVVHNEPSVSSPEKKEVDFFEEHAELTDKNEASFIEENAEASLYNEALKKNGVAAVADGEGPNVEMALGTSPTNAARVSEIRKPTIGQRKAVSAKKGLGIKKGGLGAQKVSANFSEIEREAQLAEKEQDRLAVEVKRDQQFSAEEEAKQIASIRLAYQDLSLQQKKEEEKMKQMDPKKASQMERLGMGLGGGTKRSDVVTHSAASEMKTIEQENPNKPQNYKKERDVFDDDFELIGFTTGPPRFSDNPFSMEEKLSNCGSGMKTKSSIWESERNFFEDNISSKDFSSDNGSYGRSRRVHVAPPTNSDEAVKKFGGAKSISSEQFFKGSADSDIERRANLTRFEGSSSISSAEYFGDSRNRQPAAYASYSGPDLEDIREGVRAGVTKVAGKLSNLANGMMNSLQDRYGY